MKLTLALLLVLVICASVDARRSKRVQHKNKAHSKTKIPRKISPHTLLPVTPKGEYLDNHFGAEIDASPYGPQPTLVSKDAVITDQYGKQQHTVLWHTVHTPIGYADNCKLSEMDNYELCLRIQDCDFCAANIHCGWCEATQRCMPGNKEYSVCPTACINGWIFDAQSCDGKVHAGMFTNVAPEATGFITPEEAGEKAYIRTTLDHDAIVKTPVLLGTQTEHHEISRVNPFSGVEVSHDKYETKKPIVGMIHQVKTVKTSHDQIIDVKSGKRIDQEEPHAMHGFDNYDQQHWRRRFRFGKKHHKKHHKRH